MLCVVLGANKIVDDTLIISDEHAHVSDTENDCSEEGISGIEHLL